MTSVTYRQIREAQKDGWVTLGEASARTGIHRRTLQNQCDRGYYEESQRRVPAKKRGGHEWQLSTKLGIFKAK